MMPRPSLRATTEPSTVVEVKLKPHVVTMVKTRCEEHAKLGVIIKTSKTRQKSIEGEVRELFRKEKQGKALLDGTKLAAHRMKLVIGKTKVFDQLGFMKKHGLSKEDFAEFTTYKDNEAYLKFTHPGDKDEDE